MSKHFFSIKRTGETAIVEVFEITRSGDDVGAGRMVACYETSSRGATKSARKTIKQIETAK